jgi:hypothetical protein
MPPGWPVDLPAVAQPEFAQRVVGWLLDRGPADLRTSPLRRTPLALAAYVRQHIDACLAGARTAYSRARAELAGLLEPAELEQVQQALAAEGARLLQVQREVRLVEAALRDRAESGRAT